METETQDIDVSARLVEEGAEHLKEMNMAPEDKSGEEVEPDPAKAEPDPNADEGDTLDGDKPEEKKEEEPLDEQTIADIREGKIIPKHRMDQVLQQLQSYKAFGSPEELKKSLERVQAAKADGTKAEGELSEKDKEVKAYIERMFPEFKKLSDIESEIDRTRKEREASQNAFIGSVEKKVDEFVEKELGVDVKVPKNAKLFRNLMADIIHENPEWKDRLYNKKDMSVLDEAKGELNKLLSGVQRKTKAEIFVGKKNTAKLPKPLGKGGVPPPGSPPKPDNGKVDFNQIGDDAWETISSGSRIGE